MSTTEREAEEASQQEAAAAAAEARALAKARALEAKFGPALDAEDAADRSQFVSAAEIEASAKATRAFTSQSVTSDGVLKVHRLKPKEEDDEEGCGPVRPRFVSHSVYARRSIIVLVML